MNEKIKININSIENFSPVKPKAHRSVRLSTLQINSPSHTFTPRVKPRKTSHQPVLIYRELSAKFKPVLARVRLKLKLAFAIKKATEQIGEKVMTYSYEIFVFNLA